MLGKYEKFPLIIHFLKKFSSTYNINQLQQKLLQTLKDTNRKKFHFEDISIPTIPNSEIIFEFGIAEEEKFNFLDEPELNRTLNMFKGKILDVFCAVRYYKIDGEKKIALKFDYYIFRASFVAKEVEFRVFHKQGPRYVSPEELVAMIVNEINKTTTKKILWEKSNFEYI